MKALAFVAAWGVAAGAPPTSPEEHLGRPLGRDFELADWGEVSGYFKRLAAESPRVRTWTAGTTTEGREFLVAAISDEANLARLDEIRAHARVLADPRGRSAAEKERAVREGRVILFISCAMHATETAAPQFAMEFAYRLATSEVEPWRSARERMVVVVFPSTNPDGQDLVVDWYRRTVGTPYEAAELPRLYQLYAGHDNNRDWFMLTQAETRIVTGLLYREWFPTVYWDVHQHGTDRERFFVPPFRDPLNPNLDASIIAGINLLGTRAVMDMTRAGFTGISTGVTYDMWWNGGNRNVPVRHNIVGLLTEAASVELATPVFLPITRLRAPGDLGSYAPSNRFLKPWPGGWWRLRDIIDYEMAFGESLLGSLSREPEVWLRNALEASERAIEAGRREGLSGWVIPADNRDPVAVRRLIEALILAGVEVSVSDGPVSADGREYPAGSIVIRRDQPYGAHVKDLFDVQRYPEGAPPYDVAGWTLPLLLGVRRVEVMGPLPEGLRLVSGADEATAGFPGDRRAKGDIISTHHADAWTRVAEALAGGARLRLVNGGPADGLIVPVEMERAGAGVVMSRLPRIGLYAPWTGSMDEGWMRYVLDSQRIPYVRVTNEMVRAGDLSSFLDVLIIASTAPGHLDRGRPAGSVHEHLAGGLAPEGAVAVEEFVRGGGTLVTIGSASAWAIALLKAPLVDVTAEPSGREFSCPGSVLRAIPERHELTAGLPSSVFLMFSRGSAYREMTAEERRASGSSDARVEILLRYAPTRLLQSGWIAKPEVIEGRAAWVRVSHGLGRAHLFGFQPQYRGWTTGTFQLVHRAAFLEPPFDR